MTLLVLGLLMNLAGAVPQAPARGYHWEVLGCGGGTVDAGVSIAGSVCFDRSGTRYTAVYAGGGFGGIVAISAFTFIARVKNGSGIEGHYTGGSVSGAWRWGAGVGFFTRNHGESGGGWRPSMKRDEYVIWLAGHRGAAFDVSGLTLTIVKH